MKNNYKGSFVLFLAAVALVVGFVLGTRKDEIYGVIGAQFGGSDSSAQKVDLALTQKVYNILQQKFDGTIDKNKAGEFSAKGLAQAAGDPYTTYFTKKEAEDLQKSLEGNIGGGIGAELGRSDDGIKIIRILKNTPAEKAGLQMGDVIVGINGEDVIDKNLDQVVAKVRGEVGTSVKITVARDGESKEFSIKRETITAPDVETKVIDGIGVISLSRFGEDSGSKVRSAAEKMKHDNVKGVVLDLRGNGGGYLQSGVDVASVWLKDKTVVTEKGKSEKEKVLKSSGDPILEGVPTVVLINEGSASASEIVAGALKDNKAATLIGKKSFGKGSVQELIDVGDGAVLKVTIAKWYTPSGKSINKAGIKPDKESEYSDKEFKKGNDTQLNEAVKFLKGQKQ